MHAFKAPALLCFSFLRDIHVHMFRSSACVGVCIGRAAFLQAQEAAVVVRLRYVFLFRCVRLPHPLVGPVDCVAASSPSEVPSQRRIPAPVASGARVPDVNSCAQLLCAVSFCFPPLLSMAVFVPCVALLSVALTYSPV